MSEELPVGGGGPVHDLPDPGLRPRRTRLPARFIADLVAVAIGIGLLVTDNFVHQPVYPSQGFFHSRLSTSTSGFDSSSKHWLITVGFSLIFFYGALAAVHRRPRRRRHRWPGWVVVVVGLVAGAYLILSSLVVTGIIGERANATAVGACHELHYLANSSDWSACDLSVRWPDGSTATVAAVPVASDDTTVTLAKPRFRPWPFPGDEHRYKVSDLIALLSLGAVFVGRSAVGVVLLLAGRGNDSADIGTSPAEMPSGQ